MHDMHDVVPSRRQPARLRGPAAVLAMLTAGCGAGPAPAGAPLPDTSDSPRPPTESEWFVDRTAEAGLVFTHFNGATGDFIYPELLPPGVGMLDFDRDGDLDVLLLQGRLLAGDATFADALLPPEASAPVTGRLYRNDLRPDDRGGTAVRLTDVTGSSGLTLDGYGLGVATGDIDNDGWTDVWVTNVGGDRLFRNNGDGTFTDVSAHAGIETDYGFGVSSAFVDYDRDGWLDLYVGHNIDYRADDATVCANAAGARDYCPPKAYGGLPDRLYRNRGDGTFEDVTPAALRYATGDRMSRAAGGRFGPALGVISADYDGDGWPDLYVANDGTENLLWMNQRDGTLRDTAVLSGAALSGLGATEASMGVGAADFDQDGDDDLFMTHMTTEGNNLYVNDGTGVFQDASAASGLGPGSLPYTGWGTTWVDVDNDGQLDILAVNGTVIAVDGRQNHPFPYDQPNSLFRNIGGGRFEDVTERAGAAFRQSEVSRGAAFGDIDNDGDVDVVVGNNAGPARLLVNTVGTRHHWLGLRLVGASDATGGRDMLGARAAVIRPGEPTLWRRAHTDGSYASAGDPRVLVGLGPSTAAPDVRVHWPGGRVETWRALAIDAYTTLVEGTGAAPADGGP